MEHYVPTEDTNESPVPPHRAMECYGVLCNDRRRQSAMGRYGVVTPHYGALLEGDVSKATMALWSTP